MGQFLIKFVATDQTEHTSITTKMTRSEPSSTVSFLSLLGSSWATGTGVIFSKIDDFGGIFSHNSWKNIKSDLAT